MLQLQEGTVVLTATAVDGAGNTATITRPVSVGFSTPVLTVTAPAFDASGRFATGNLGVTLVGRVDAPAALAADGSFSLPLSLALGDNPVRLTATSVFGQSASTALVVSRTAGVLPPGIVLDWPQPGFVVANPALAVRGHVSAWEVPITGTASQPGIVAVAVNGVPMALAGGVLSGSVRLQAAGPNALLLVATALDGNTRQATRTVILAPRLPQLVLSAPASARPGDSILIQVSPGSGTNLVKADLTWNGRFLATVTAP